MFETKNNFYFVSQSGRQKSV